MSLPGPGTPARQSRQAYLLLHGWQNHRPDGHWQRWLAERLRDLGHHVSYPQLPDPDEPDLDGWLTVLRRELEALPPGRRTVVGHSLGCLLWLHAVARSDRPQRVERAILVAPPGAAVVAEHAEIAAFADLSATRDGLAAMADRTVVIASDNDPYCPAGADREYGRRWDLPVEVIPGAGHLDLAAGYGAWPMILDRCVAP